jgi:hypothetical protein
MLKRRHLNLCAAEYIGKESDRLEDRAGGVVDDAEPHFILQYGTETDVFAELVLPVLGRLSVSEVARRSGLSRPAITDIVKRRKVAGRPYSRAKLIEVAVDIAAEAMQRRPARSGSWIAFLTEYRDAVAVKEA